MIVSSNCPRHMLPVLLGSVLRFVKEAADDRHERRELARQARRFADDLLASDDLVEAQRTDFARVRRRP
jgi:hypothetical protein